MPNIERFDSETLKMLVHGNQSAPRLVDAREYWFSRAAETRAMARTMRMQKFRDLMFAIADTYDRIAREAKPNDQPVLQKEKLARNEANPSRVEKRVKGAEY